MEDTATFGGFLKEKRQSKNISLRKFAELAGISPVYMCNMEKDRNPAPSEEVLNRLVKLLLLTEEETALFFDLAAKSKKIPAVSQDLPAYIMDRDSRIPPCIYRRRRSECSCRSKRCRTPPGRSSCKSWWGCRWACPRA